jgi:integrase/recombinase XerD
MLLLTTAALPQLEQHRHPNLGRLITPRHYARLDDTLAARLPVAVDNDCYQGLDPVAVCRMLGAVMPWPSVGARIRRAWPMLPVGSEALLGFEELPRPHPRLLWVAVPDVVGDADATLELFRFWHPWLCHLLFCPGSCCSWLVVVWGMVAIAMVVSGQGPSGTDDIVATMSFQRLRIELASGVAYFSVVDEEFELVEFADAWLRYLRLGRGRSEGTTAQYASAVAAFANWAARARLWPDLNACAQRLDAFVFQLRATPVSRKGTSAGRLRGPNRINEILSAVRQLYEYAKVHRLVDRDVDRWLYELHRPQRQRVPHMEDPPAVMLTPRHRLVDGNPSDPRTVSFEEFLRITAVATSWRDRFLVEMLHLGGLRVAEAVALRKSQVHFAESSVALGCSVAGPHLHVVGKGSRSRIVPAHSFLVSTYARYQLERDTLAAARESDFVLANLGGGVVGAPMTTGRARRIVASLANRAGLGRHVTPHQLRHGMASEMLNRGRALDEIQVFLGHASVNTTRIYARTDPARVRAAVEAVALPGGVPA